MIGATKRWFRRNRNGLAIGAGVIGVSYLAGQYVLSKILEARERVSSDKIARENLRRRFEQNQTDCTFTVLALLPTAVENILEALPVEELTNELQQKKSERLSRIAACETTASEISSGSPSVTDDDGRNLSCLKSEAYVHSNHLSGSAAGAEGQKARSRNQLWNELKINSITRSFTLIYTLSLLTLLTRIQLNLLGRRNYLSSVVSLASPPLHTSTISLEDHDGNLGYSFGNDFETNRRYLTFSWWLLHRGWKNLMVKVQAAVQEIFGPVNPREEITQERLSEMTLAVRRKIEGATSEDRRSKKWLPYLLPPVEQEDFVLRESGVLSSTESSPQSASSLRHLLDETSDLIDSPPFTHILTLLNNEAFSTLIDEKCAAEAFKTSASQPTARKPDQTPLQSSSSAVTIIPISGPTTPKVKLAAILAVISRQAHSIGNGTNPPNEYLVSMEQGVRELEAFAAVVYSSNFDFEVPTSMPDSAEPVANPSSVDLTSPSPHPSPYASPKSAGTVTPPGGEASIISLGASSASVCTSREVNKAAITPANVHAKITSDPDFEKVWGKVLYGHGRS